MRLLKAALDAMAASLELYAAQARTGVTVIEAAAMDKFNTELRAFTATEAEREDLRQAALEFGKAGLTAKEVEPMVRAYYGASMRLKQFAHTLNRYADELTPGGNA